MFNEKDIVEFLEVSNPWVDHIEASKCVHEPRNKQCRLPITALFNFSD